MAIATETPATARAFWVVAPGYGEIRAEELREPGHNELLIQTIYSAISRGTESLVFLGRVPSSEAARMRCPFQTGDFPGPVKYGYCSVGRVVQGPSSWRGRRIFCLYPHQTHYVVSIDDVVPLPAQLPTERAVLAANLETALNAVWDARVQFADRVSVVGAGTVGSLCAYLACRAGAEVELVDVAAERAALAHNFGVAFATPNVAATQRDLVFEASGRPEGLLTALSLAAPEATIISLSWFGDSAVNLPLGEAFHSQRLRLHSSQVGQLSPYARSRFTRKTRLELAVKLCSDPVLAALCSEESSFDSLPETLARLASPGASAFCHRIRYQSDAH